MSSFLVVRWQIVSDSCNFILYYTYHLIQACGGLSRLTFSQFSQPYSSQSVKHLFRCCISLFCCLQQDTLTLTALPVLSQCNCVTIGHVLFVITGFSTFTMSSTISHSAGVTSNKRSFFPA